jgi:predicted nucleotidyltransferase
MKLSSHEFDVDIAACRESFAAREERKLAEREKRRQTALEAAASVLNAILPRYSKVHRAYLFGSVVRPGAFRLDSDVDVAVEGIEAADYFALWRDLERAMPDWPVDLRDLVPGTHFAERVQMEGHLIYESKDSGAES